MAIEWFKIQTPMYTTSTVPIVLLYNEDRSMFAEIKGDVATQLIDGLGMATDGDKVYVQGIINADDQFIANKDTLTRRPEKKGITW